MTTEQPTALRLADAMLDLRSWNETGPKALMQQAAAELRRLHTVLEMNTRTIAMYENQQLDDKALMLRALHVLEIEQEWYDGPVPRVDELIEALRERLGVDK